MTTALVTGASAGIGRAFAVGLAARGHDLVLVARDRTRLDELAAQLIAAHRVAVEVLRADLLDRADLEVVATRVGDDARPVDVLVNNAGFGTYGRFVDLDVAHEVEEVELNVVALLRLSHAALAAMQARGSGAILNVGSVAGYQPDPRSATYGATKAFVLSFTHALRTEARGSGVQVMVVCPGYTHTEFHERAGLGPSSVPELLWQTPDEVVTVALRDLDRRRAVSIPGVLNRTAAALSSMAPPGISGRVAGLVVKRT